MILKAAALDELDKLARKIELAGGLDVEKVKAIIRNRMDALKNE